MLNLASQGPGNEPSCPRRRSSPVSSPPSEAAPRGPCSRPGSKQSGTGASADYGRVILMLPSATAGSHESLPLYDDERLVAVTPDAETSMTTRHVGVGWLPPSANDILNVTVVPETDPEMLPSLTL